MPDINIGALSEAINDKMDRDAQNVDTVSGADCVIEFQAPTADNNYTWYRKYKSGWVEQGGYIVADGTTYSSKAITLPVAMNGQYFVQRTFNKGAGNTSGFNWIWIADSQSGQTNTATTVYLSIPSNSYVIGMTWEVKGMYAQ